jgi:hypothetical protein
LQHAVIAGHVEILNGATGIPGGQHPRLHRQHTSIVSTFQPALSRCAAATWRYFEVLSQMGLNQIEGCPLNILGDAII